MDCATSNIIELVQNDTKPHLEIEITDYNDAPVDLTGATVNLKFRKKKGDKSVINTGHTGCSIIDATGGVCRYSFVAGDLASVGYHEAEIEVTFEPGVVQSVPDLVEFYVREEF